MNPFSMAPQGAGGATYGFNTSPAYMGDGSTGGAQPGTPSMGLLASLQPFLQRMQAQQAMGQRMMQQQRPAAPAAPAPGAPAPAAVDGNGNPAQPAQPPGLLNGILGAGGANGGLLNQLFKSFAGQGNTPGQPLNILPPGPTP